VLNVGMETENILGIVYICSNQVNQRQILHIVVRPNVSIHHMLRTGPRT
jgi:hypothetical protein